jgi:trk system potassium uptake protein TrkH
MAVLSPPKTRPPAADQRRWLDLPQTVFAAIAAAGLLAEYGFFTPLMPVVVCRLTQAVAVTAFLAIRVLLSGRAGTPPGSKGYWLDLAVIPAAAIAAGVRGVPVVPVVISAGVLYVTILQAGCLAGAAFEQAVQCVVRPGSRGRPVRLILAWYLALIVVGGLLLAVPQATTADHRNSPYTHLLNSAFAATSAACTAGLTIYELSSGYTLFGKVVILVLVQLGGVGMLVFGTLFGMLLVRRLAGGPAAPAWTDERRVRRIVTSILSMTLGLEAAGAILLYPVWSDGAAPLDSGFRAVFHAVGAFCNSGFTLQKDSLVGLGTIWQVYGVILPLAVIGALGFPVVYEIGCRVRRGPGSGEAPLLPLPDSGWSLHTRLALATALWLIIAGLVGLMLLEAPGPIGYWYVGKGNLLAPQDATQVSPEWMRSHDGTQRMLDALFQATAAPTAGLRTVPIDPGKVSPATHFLLMMWMFVGGAPASTAGGVKTVAFAILILYAISILRRRSRLEVLGCQVRPNVVRRVLALFFVSAAWLAAAILILAHTERASFLAVAFEAVSAFSTNGLSLGVTPNLTALGKGLIILTMLAGRIGPLAMMIALAEPDEMDAQSPAAEMVALA